MRARVLAALFLLIALTVGLGFEAYQWKRTQEQATLYLFGDTGLKDAKGRPIRRVDILDATMHQIVASQPELKAQLK